MQLKFSVKHFLIEIFIATLISLAFSVFGLNFAVWLLGCLLLLLLWHHYNEQRLLRMLYPPKEKTDELTTWDHISQTVAYYKSKNRRDKIKTLRLLSKLNRNIQYLPDGIIIFRRNGDISWCNNMAQEILDFYWDKKVSKNVFKVIFYEEFKHYWKQSSHKRPLVIFTDKERYLEVHLTPYDAELTLLIIRDVTQLIRLLHARQTFLANMNHELRTPLTVLQGYLELFENQDNLNEFQQKALQAMLEQSKRMAKLLKQLNILAKAEHSNNEAHSAFNMSEMILNLQKGLHMVADKNHRITFEVLPDIYVVGDENQLQSAVSNLIYNAIKHSGDENEIRVCWQSCPQGMEFSVTDNGQGIEPQHIPHLTERFYRVDESRANLTGGSGLGLAIVKHVLHQHHSYLDINSEVGKGSRFSFVIKADLIVKEQDAQSLSEQQSEPNTKAQKASQKE